MRLVAAGIEHFGTAGYASTSIERLCSDARVSTRAFYELFESREALLRAVVEQILDEARAQVLRVLERGEADPAALAMQGIRAFVDTYTRDPRRGRIVLVECVGVSAEFERYRREAMRGFARIIERQATVLVARGLLPARSYELGALAMAGAINELLVDSLFRSDPPSADEIACELVAIVEALIRGLGPVPAQTEPKPRKR